jgi:uncharacterized membrane protein YfcA
MLAAVLGSLVGIVLGLTGAGGSIFAVPLLVFGLGWSLSQATPVALLAVCTAAASGTLAGWRSGLIARRAALLAGALGSLAAPLGLALAARLPQRALAGAFALVMTIVALRMLRQASRTPDEAGVVRGDPASSAERGAAVCRIDEATSRLRWTRSCAVVLGASGAATGVLSGALGVGAGFVIVPTLRAVTELSMPACVATSLMTITLVSAAAVAAHVAVHGGAVRRRCARRDARQPARRRAAVRPHVAARVRGTDDRRRGHVALADAAGRDVNAMRSRRTGRRPGPCMSASPP